MVVPVGIPTQERGNERGSRNAGFTLLELLAVIMLLGVLAGGALLAYEGVQDDGEDTLARFEMAEIRKALLQFRRDTHELPCRVYRAGDYQADKDNMTELDFAGLPTTPNADEYHAWCRNAFSQQQDSGLSMLHRFPYDETDSEHVGKLWNPDTRRGWHGPYINEQGLTDPWGQRYILLDPELTYPASYRCRINSTDDGYDTTDDDYECLSPDDEDFFDPDAHILPANVARLVSLGPNGRLDSEVNYANVNEANWCKPKPSEDDLVLCLFR
ncbi:type II secretion system protein GspG [Methylotuvimicrobium sp.]|uniref:type II secretion system protein GspG n=1 Tax=Methylotuvimicrobium sp. TaxID=2822413 RepID=UPI003D646CB2